jgi:DNA repair exonuclease SbcCD ATPase subunit
MTDTAIPAETVVTDASKTAVTPEVTPAPAPVKTEDTGIVEQLRKEKEQAEMRANQLANQLKSREEAEAKAKEAELEENNQFKELFEQEKAKREALESEQSEKEQKAELEKAKTTVLAGFSDEVKTLAEELGFELTSADDAQVEAFKGKLDKLSQKVSSEARVAPNNPHQQESKMDLTTDQLREGLSDEHTFHDIVTKKFPGIAAMTAPPRK